MNLLTDRTKKYLDVIIPDHHESYVIRMSENVPELTNKNIINLGLSNSIENVY